MKTVVISYSRTGNNQILAKAIAAGLSAEHVTITMPGEKSFFSIGMDMLFNRTPKVNTTQENHVDFQNVVFVGPVWMGQIASPLRAPVRKHRNSLQQYAFVSISGGADGPNTKLTAELKKRIGKDPVSVVNFLIAEMLPADPKPTREQTEAYRLDEAKAEELARKVMEELKTFS